MCSTVRGGKNGPCEAGALIAVVNDYVFVDKIYSRDASGMGQAGTFWSSRSGMPESIFLGRRNVSKKSQTTITC